MPLFWERRRRTIILAALVVAHLLLISIQIPRGAEKTYFEKAIFFLFSPVQKAAVSAYRGIANLWTGYFDLRGVRAENRELKRELFFARQENRHLADRLRQFEAEARTRESLEDFRDTLVAARVVGIDTANVYSSIVVDQGLLAGIRRDMAVCDKFGHLVGRTVDPIGVNEATIQLITDSLSNISVISNRDRIVGVLSGTSSELCVLRYVLATTSGGQPGEELMTTGYDGIYPPGLRVGRILSVRPEEGTVFKNIVVQPFYNFNALETVALLPKRGEEKQEPR